jgi:hypothetical protein
LRFEAVKSRTGRRVCRSSHNFHLAGMVADRGCCLRATGEPPVGLRGGGVFAKAPTSEILTVLRTTRKERMVSSALQGEHMAYYWRKLGVVHLGRCPCRDCSSAPPCCPWQVFFSPAPPTVRFVLSNMVSVYPHSRHAMNPRRPREQILREVL